MDLIHRYTTLYDAMSNTTIAVVVAAVTNCSETFEVCVHLLLIGQRY